MAKKRRKYTDEEILSMVERCDGNRGESASRLGITPQHLLRRIRDMRNRGVAVPGTRSKKESFGYFASTDARKLPNLDDLPEPEYGVEYSSNLGESMATADPELLKRSEEYSRRMAVMMALGNWEKAKQLVDVARQDFTEPESSMGPLLEEPLAGCGIPARLVNAIEENCNAIYIGDLQQVTTQQLLKSPNLGARSVDKIWHPVLQFAANRVTQLQRIITLDK